MTVLIAYDGSPESEAAVDEAARRAWAPGTLFRLLTVEAPMDARLVRGSPTVFDKLIQQQKAESARRLREAARRLKKGAPKMTVENVMKEGWPKQAILNEAEEWGADLILIGSQGFGALKRFLLGSVSLAVAANAPCSVEIVRKASPAE